MDGNFSEDRVNLFFGVFFFTVCVHDFIIRWKHCSQIMLQCH